MRRAARDSAALPASGRSSSWEGRSVRAWASLLGVSLFEAHASIGSTGDRAAAVAAAGVAPALILADRQTAGRGRRGRRWHSDTPLGLWFTAVREFPVQRGGAMALRCGLAAALGLEALAPALAVGIEWPNDLTVGGRKIGGVLLERVGERLLVGVGINVDQRRRDFPSEIGGFATSMRIETAAAPSRGAVLEAVAPRILAVAPTPDERIPGAELEALEARSPLRGRRVRVDGVATGAGREPRRIEGSVLLAGSVRSDGSLEARDEAGRRMRVVAGSVTLLARAKAPAGVA